MFLLILGQTFFDRPHVLQNASRIEKARRWLCSAKIESKVMGIQEYNEQRLIKNTPN